MAEVIVNVKADTTGATKNVDDLNDSLNDTSKAAEKASEEIDVAEGRIKALGGAINLVGGSVEWKWDTAKEWVDFAHDKEMKCHIGQVGQLHYLIRAYEYGADSVDSSSIVRNKSWGIIDKFKEATSGRQSGLFERKNTGVLSSVQEACGAV